MGWFSIITADGVAYQLMGSDNIPPIDSAKQTAITITPTRTSILFEAGPVTVNVTYLSPIEVNFTPYRYTPHIIMSLSSLAISFNNRSLFPIIIYPLLQMPRMR